MINIIGLAVQNKMTANTLLTAQIGTHPLVTAPPTAYPIIKAIENAVKIRMGENSDEKQN